MALRIRIEHGQDAGKTWRLGTAGTYRFGRNPASSVQVLDMKVSKDHFEIAFADDVAAMIRDLESSHGTLLNGQPVTYAGRPLVPGDEIRVGLTVLRVLSDGPADGEAPVKGPPPTPTNGAASAPAGAAARSPAGPAARNPAGAAPAAGGDTTSRRTAPSAGGAPPQGGATLQTGGARSVGDTTARRSAPLPPDALVGQTLAGYKILEKVGAGGMGAVYRAEQLSLHREVALKVLAEKLVSDSAFVDQFQNEARAAGALNHPNVVQVYDVGHADGRHFFSMEFIHGGSIEGRIPKGARGGVPWTDALSWFLDAANALVFAERKGVLHRDIKPDNFMISQDGSAKLCDLGLAKKSESDDLLAQGIIGTPHFISPEAIRRKTDVDQRSDLYSLGCTFYKVLTGKNPYPLGSVKEILLAHLNAPVPRASALVSDVPKELDEIVFKLMQKEPADRFPNSAELWNALDKVRLQFGMAAHGLNPGRAKKIAILISVAALAAIGVALKIALTEQEAPPPIVVINDRPQDPDSIRQAELQRIENAYLGLENEELRLGKDFSKEEAWEAMARKWDDFAKEWAGKPREEDATRKATVIRTEVQNYKTALAKHEKDVRECCSLVDGTAAKAKADAQQLRKDGKPIEAEKVIAEALRIIGKQLEQKDAKQQPLYEPKAGKKVQDDLLALVDPLVHDVEGAWKTARDAGEAERSKGTLEALEKAQELYEQWLEAHPLPDASAKGRVAQKITEFREVAASQVEFLKGQWKDTRDQQLLTDNKAHYTTLREAYRAPPADGAGGRGGWFAEFEAANAASAFEKAASDSKTPEFKQLNDRRAAEARLAAALVNRLAKSFAEKPWKDVVVGSNFKGPIQEVRPEGLKVANQDRFFRIEGLAFFVDLFFDAKGQERFALTADEHEGLAVLSEAAGITFDGKAEEVAGLFERAQKEFERAATLDAARADRLKRRLEAASQEGGTRRLFLEARESLESAEAMMTTLFGRLNSGDKKERDAAPKEVAEKEKEIGALIQGARQKAEEIERRFPGTTARAILADPKDRPPDGARYAGVDVPVEKPEPGPDAPIKAPPPPKDGAAMGDGAAMADGAMGDGTPPGMEADGPAAGMDAPAPQPPPAGMDTPPPAGMDPAK